MSPTLEEGGSGFQSHVLYSVTIFVSWQVQHWSGQSGGTYEANSARYPTGRLQEMIGAWVAGSQPPRRAGLGVRAEPSEHLLLGHCSTPTASSQPHFVVGGTKDQGSKELLKVTELVSGRAETGAQIYLLPKPQSVLSAS